MDGGGPDLGRLLFFFISVFELLVRISDFPERPERKPEPVGQWQYGSRSRTRVVNIREPILLRCDDAVTYFVVPLMD